MVEPSDIKPIETGAIAVPTSWRDSRAHARLWVTAIGALAFDLASKSWAFQSLSPHEARPFVPGLVEFRRSLNDGAVFGSFTGYVGLFIIASVGALFFVLYLFSQSARTHRSLHVALGLILSGALGNLYDRIFMQADVVRPVAAVDARHGLIGRVTQSTDETFTVETWPEGGNPQVFSRSEVGIRRQGVVRDFIKFIPRFPEWIPQWGGRDVWPWVFNIADAALVCGVMLLFLHSWFDGRNRTHGDSATSDPAPVSP
jgi:lipoprotein signal peptidase